MELKALARQFFEKGYTLDAAGQLRTPTGRPSPVAMRISGQWFFSEAIAAEIAKLDKPKRSAKRSVPVGEVLHRPAVGIGT